MREKKIESPSCLNVLFSHVLLGRLALNTNTDWVSNTEEIHALQKSYARIANQMNMGQCKLPPPQPLPSQKTSVLLTTVRLAAL